MPLAPDLSLAFGALALAVLALWMPAPAVRGNRDWLWCVVLLAACAVAKAVGVLDARGLAATFVYLALAFGARESGRAWVRVPLLVLTGVCALLLALHRLPGFHNPVLFDHVQVSVGAPPYTLYANFDKAVAGIVLMGVFCAPLRTWTGWATMLRRTLPVLAATLVVVLGAGVLLGVVRPDVKWLPATPWFLVNNLLITCVTEEAFFRGFLLAGLARRMAGLRAGRRFGVAVAVVVSTVLFGLAHAPGGPLLVAFATLAGCGYAAAYLRSGRVEGAILTHFALNAVHFVAFTYPALMR